MSISTFTILLILTYIIIIKIVSYFAHRSSVKTVEDFFLAGRQTGVIALIGTLTATKVNGLALTAAPGFIYQGGILFFQTFIAVIISCLLTIYFGPLIWEICQKNHFLTQGELFGDHYQSRTIYGLTVGIGIVSIFPFLVAQFAAVGKIFSTAMNNVITYEQSVLFLAIITGLYVFLGGAKAVIWTDVVQGIVFLFLLLLSAILFTHWAGGYGAGIATLTTVIPEKLVFNRHNTPVFFDQALSWSFAYFLWPQIFQRMMMGKSSQVVGQAAWINFAIGLLVKVALLTMGIMGTALLYGQITDSDRLVAEVYNQHFPLGGSLIVLALFACGMSSIDSILLSVASIFTCDIVDKLLPQPLSEAANYRLAQSISIITLAVATALALSDLGRGYLATLVTVGATLATFLLWPLLGMFIWKGKTKIAVISAMVLGLGTLGITTFINNVQILSIPIGNSTVVFLVSLISFITVSSIHQQLLKVQEKINISEI